MAVLFAVSILAPHLALAASVASSHCLTMSEPAHLRQDAGPAAQEHGKHEHGTHDHAKAAGHHQADAASSDHADPMPPASTPDPDGQARSCCGVFCLTGLPAIPAATLAAPADTRRVAADLDRSTDGRGPDRIIRPPKA